MLPDAALPVPASLMTLLAVVSPLFTAPSFRTFTGLACGFLAQSGKRTVCGVLTGAGLSRAWPHDRAHYFFSRARWNPDDLGICVAKLVIGLLVPDGEPDEVLIDDTLFRRRGKKVWAASWNAALHELPPERTGKRGRPRKKGGRLPALAKIATAAAFSQVTVTRYGALVTTEKTPGIAAVIERYAARWSIEVAIEDAKQLFGTGQPRNRTARAVERTIPFMLARQAIAVCWYAAAGHHPADTEARRLDAHWYTTKTEPSTADMTAKLRRVIIAARFKRLHADQPEPAEIHAIRLAWEDAEDLAA